MQRSQQFLPLHSRHLMRRAALRQGRFSEARPVAVATGFTLQASLSVYSVHRATCNVKRVWCVASAHPSAVTRL
ncbi:hypothetical protein BaRGS_00019645 [Batillaria attramentaria]|uniref:Uncharacterized protein n=1 Tax=Batillaria attramentaria TaxID=370345 RepID=A0ABD0KPH5_9CAEN